MTLDLGKKEFVSDVELKNVEFVTGAEHHEQYSFGILEMCMLQMARGAR